ncbi:hypothetical protein Ana3638_12380 [Anaerocolumna sedimenticola]|jgi:NTP pyrophosphatase (non-canonical NTP hydrolase)|uniref:Uncharacterized protein n=1 Tax=Anaerocolumna sedimenticola TaxID=2696063 RepID=A0A6P1TPB8_9FIRM|nr:hypothetical protein [Anaerocolumna sedimenticola]QHQ61475.1 hypothetical protein Ana3638_12380 [Anaerocolumna sedimenticola]
MSDKVNGFDISKIDVSSLIKNIDYSASMPKFTQPAMPEIIPYGKLQLEEQQEFKKLFQAYQEESLRVLRAIEQNTANLYTLVDLISKNNEQQDELIAIIAEVLTIAKAKSKKEAESTYTKVMGRITQTVKDAETLAKVAGYATTVWQLAQPIIDKLPF